MDKIIGNIVGIPNPQSDMNQTDPSKADYVHNKMDETELKLRDERLKYYGDPDIVPSDESLFSIILNSSSDPTGKLCLASGKKDIDGEIVIPYKGIPRGETTEVITTSLQQSGFRLAKNITSVILPNTINRIDTLCFFGCVSLKLIYIPSSVTDIGIDAFKGCTDLTITCAEGSYADTYANDHNINVEYTDEVTKAYIDKKLGSVNTSLSSAIEDGVFKLTAQGTTQYTSSIMDGVLKIV